MSQKAPPPDELVRYYERLYEEALERFPDADHRAARKRALETLRRKRTGRRGRPRAYGVDEVLRLYRLIEENDLPSVWQGAKRLASKLDGGGGTVVNKARALMRTIDEVYPGNDLVIYALRYMKSKEYKREQAARERNRKLDVPRDIERLAKRSDEHVLRELVRRGYSDSFICDIMLHIAILRPLLPIIDVQRSLAPSLEVQRRLGSFFRSSQRMEASLCLQKQAGLAAGLQRDLSFGHVLAGLHHRVDMPISIGLRDAVQPMAALSYWAQETLTNEVGLTRRLPEPAPWIVGQSLSQLVPDAFLRADGIAGFLGSAVARPRPRRRSRRRRRGRRHRSQKSVGPIRFKFKD